MESPKGNLDLDSTLGHKEMLYEEDQFDAQYGRSIFDLSGL
jgi:hypothetical protein